jgi:hypothetical protein
LVAGPAPSCRNVRSSSWIGAELLTVRGRKQGFC